MLCNLPTLVCKLRIYISHHLTTVKNTRQIITFLQKLLHNSNKSRNFAAQEPAKPLYDA